MENNNTSIKFLMRLIQRICSENLSKQDCITSGIVDQVNTDGTVNVHIPPDNVIFTGIPNQCPFQLSRGDTVKLMKEKGRASNMWVIAKCGATNQSTNAVLDIAHPIGSYYWSENPTDPSVLFGGTWERIKDKFILAAGDNYEIGEAGVNNTQYTGNDQPHNNMPPYITAYCWKRTA